MPTPPPSFSSASPVASDSSIADDGALVRPGAAHALEGERSEVKVVENRPSLSEQGQKDRSRTIRLGERVTANASRPTGADRIVDHVYREGMHRLAAAVECRDDETGVHIVRMAYYAYLIGGHMGVGSDDGASLLLATPLHDIGKIGIPDAILLKPGKLTPAEFEVMKDHTVIGGRILRGTESPLLQMAEVIALTHHERFDGKGYPYGLCGEEIPLVGRITAVADVFDALTSQRVYKPAYSADDSVKIISAGAGGQFDPEVVKAFHQALDSILDVLHEYQEVPAATGALGPALPSLGVAALLESLETRLLN
ncbi:MAG: HD domain-containing protein [Actinobacteria bacterium]|nr:HD domain-containing protein [Actinomycetota bacterium]